MSAALGAGEKVQVSGDGANWFDATVGGQLWLSPVLLAAKQTTLAAQAAAGSTSITLANADSFVVGDVIVGSGFAANTKVTAVNTTTDVITISVGTTDIVTSGTSVSGSTLFVRTIDAAGNVTSGHATNGFVSYSLDTTKPGAPSVALAQDTGNSSDGITSNGQINVTLVESVTAGGAGGFWEYNVNNTGWNLGSGSSFTVTGDGAKSVLVRQTDAAGNTTAMSSAFTFTLASITSLSNVTVDLSDGSDTGTSITDNLTNDTTPTF